MATATATVSSNTIGRPRRPVQSGWKDSQGRVFHRTDSTPKDPSRFAKYGLCLRSEAARLAASPRRSGIKRKRYGCGRRPFALRENFEAKFWCEELSVYALALDGAKQPCAWCHRTRGPECC